jgi:hypothetical protein
MDISEQRIQDIKIPEKNTLMCPVCGHFVKRTEIIWDDHLKGIPSLCFACYEDQKKRYFARRER